MLEIPWLLSCCSSAKLDTGNTERVSGFIVRQEGRLAGNGSGGSARDSSHAGRLRSHDKTGFRVGKDAYQDELCQPDRGAAIGGGCRVVCTVGKPRSSRTLMAALNTTVHRDSPNAPSPFLFTKSETPATAGAPVTAIKQHPLAFSLKQFESGRLRLQGARAGPTLVLGLHPPQWWQHGRRSLGKTVGRIFRRSAHKCSMLETMSRDRGQRET
jgi:hypothetical protein